MRALITGITGQDGYFMAEQLLAQGVNIVALVRDVERAKSACSELSAGTQFLQFCFNTRNAISDILETVQPDFIFNFAAKSTGEGMFDNLQEMDRLNQGFPVEILHAIISSSRRKQIRFVQASSSEMYGANDRMPQTEMSEFRPTSPYGATKLYVHQMIGIYRQMYGLHVSSAILFNHESQRRGDTFVTSKIAKAVARIKAGQQNIISLGNISSLRDWGYAPEYVDAMLKMAKSEKPDDYVIATGKLNSVEDILKVAFDTVNLDYRDHLVIGDEMLRKVDSKGHCGNSTKIYETLGWKATRPVLEIIAEMVYAEIEKFQIIREPLLKPDN